MRVRRPIYTPEFRADAVALVQRSDRSFAQVAADLGVSLWSLRAWYKKETMKRSKKKREPVSQAITAGESAEDKVKRLERENGRLEREVEKLKMDREILKKAAAFFAKESE
jgi:transposase-like protein